MAANERPVVPPRRFLLNHPEFRAHRDFWAAQSASFKGASRFEDSLFVNTPAAPQTHVIVIAPENRDIISRIGKGKPIGEFVVFLSSLAALMHRYCGSELFCFESPLFRENDEAKGFASNVPLVLRVDGSRTLRELLVHVQQIVSASYTFQNFPIGELLPSPPQAVFVVHHAIHSPSSGTPENALVFHDGVADGCTVLVEDRRGVFSAESVQRLTAHWNALLASFRTLDNPIHDLEIVSRHERQELLETFNQTDYPECAPPLSVSQLFEEIARKYPSALAIVAGDSRLSYEELNRQANRLAQHMVRELGIARGEAVGVMSDRSEFAIIALLATIKSGAVYVPLSPTYPHARLRQVVEDVRAKAILIHSRFFDCISDFADLPMFCLDLQLHQLEGSAADGIRSVAHEDLMAVIYTSGSEGRPKGVLIEHRGIANVALDHIRELKMTPEDRYLQFMALSFDGSLLDIFTALLAGSALVMVQDEVLQNLETIHRLLEETGVTVFTMTPSYLKLLDPGRLSKVRTIISAAETAKPDDAEFFARTKDFYNGYGPSEACVNTTLHKVQPGRKYATIPVGQPRANKKVYVLDQRRNLLPRGVIGEIAISGLGLSPGYLNDAELTRAKFIEHPFILNERLCLTGDLGAWNERGELVFQGRRDQQVKIRGFRIELGEIEKALLSHPQVRDVAVLYDESREKILAFFTGDAVPDQVAGFLRPRLPDYMLPAGCYGCERFPVTGNGKIDRSALLRLAASGPPVAEVHGTPSNETEAVLLDIWRNVLETPSAGVDSDFFGFGGDSIRIIQMVQEAHLRGIRIDTLDVIHHRTVRSLAAFARENHLSDGRGEAIPLHWAELSPAERGELPAIVEDAYPVSRMQQLMLEKYEEPLCALNGVYHCLATWRLHDRSLSPQSLRSSILALIKRHRSLRTGFLRSNISGRLLQVVMPPDGEQLEEFDLRGMISELRHVAVEDRLSEDLRRRYKVGDHGSFTRFYFFLLSDTECQIALSMHHSVIDGWSGIQLENDLVDYYHAFKSGAAPTAEPASVDSYKEFVALEQEILRAEDARSFWDRQLSGATVGTLRQKYNVGDAKVFGTATLMLNMNSSAALTGAAVKLNVTLKAVCLAAFLNAWHEHTGETRLTVGVISNGRSERLTEPLQSTGLFWNIVPFASEMRPEAGAIQEHLNQIERYARYPLAHILETRGTEELFHACFNFIQFHSSRETMGDLELLEFRANDRFHYPLTFVVSALPSAEGLHFEFRAEYHRRYLNEADVNSLFAAVDEYCTGREQAMRGRT